MSDVEIRYMEKFKVGELTIEPKTQILMEGSNSPQLFTALRGMGLRYKLLENGRRQVLNMVFPGDFLGLQAGMLGEMQHSVEATTRMTLCVFDRNELWNFFRNHPERAYDITWLAAVEEHFLGAALTTLGQRDARQRIAWSLVRVYQKCKALGLVESGSIPFPFRQQDLADALGLSLVHTNKTLARLRERQIANWADGRLTVTDLERLAELAMLEIEPEPVRPLM
jgi:CRP-like cAMP-binding protein